MRRRTFLRLSTAAGGSTLLRGLSVGAVASARVLVVGGGFAGAMCALTLRRLSPTLEVTLVDPDDRYVTCPMSNSVLVGLRDLKSISVTRDGLQRAGVRYVHDRINAIDIERRQARLGGGAALGFDRLVMAPGIRFLWGKPEGYDEAATAVMPHAWQAGAQTELLAAQLRDMRNGGVVAISVPAGPMRCPPGPFERASLIASYLYRYKRRSKVLIFDANNQFPRQDVFTTAWQSLYPGMIEWIPVVEDGAVVRVSPRDRIIYTSQQAHRVDVANIIPAQAPALLAAQAGLASDHGWCPIDPRTFESQLIAGVHVIGDACIADPMPKAASAACAQAKQCALAIVAALSDREPAVPVFDSVCFSLLAPGKALSIHGHFHVTAGRIEITSSLAAAGDAAPSDAAPSDAAPSDVALGDAAPSNEATEAKNADVWYRNIVADSFGG